MQNLVSDTKKDQDQLENFGPGLGPGPAGTTLQIPNAKIEKRNIEKLDP
jgi:hypothetical protein